MASTMKIDEIDLAIIDFLVQDGRMSCEEIAAQIGDISARAVRYRMNAMLEHSVIQISAIPDPLMLGLNVTADVDIEVEPGSVFTVGKKLASYDNVIYVAGSTGDHDISIQVVAHSNSDLFAFVADEIGNIPGVRKTTTSITPMVLKRFGYRVASLVSANKD
jgi:Lrp/AsnC family transcriptional regulator for asnA, asnC and gidA